MPSRLRIRRCSRVSLVVKTTGGFFPTNPKFQTNS